MIAKELLDWFPQAQIVDQPIDKEGFLTLASFLATVDFTGGSWTK